MRCYVFVDAPLEQLEAAKMRDGSAMSEFLVGVCKKASAFVGIITFAYIPPSPLQLLQPMLMPPRSSSDADADMGADAQSRLFMRES